MKLCLIAALQPGDLDFWPNLGFGYLAAFARREFPDLQVSVAGSVAEIERLGPDLVGISSVSQNYSEAIRLARIAKSRARAPVLVGGPHITALPQTLDPSMDVAILGEGERTLVELLRLFDRAGSFLPKDLRDLLGIAFRNEQGKVTRTALRPMIEPLDNIPHPDRELLQYRGEDTYLFTSRGCPFHCAFCSSTVHWKKFRAFSAAYVIGEIRRLHERHGTRRIHFFDDLFVADKKRLEEICRLAKDEPWHGRMEFSCAVRAELVAPEMVESLRSLGVTRATFGAESQDEQVLTYLKGASASPLCNQRAVDLLSEAGIRVGLSFIKGAPGETKLALGKTYDFIRRNIRAGRMDQADINVLTPYPGTAVWDLAQKQGVVSERMDWSLLRRPWPKLVLNRLLLDEAAWALRREQDIQALLEFVRSAEVRALLVPEKGARVPDMEDLGSRLARVQRVTQWFIPCDEVRTRNDERRSHSEIGNRRSEIFYAGPDAAERWAEPARDRIHLRVWPAALERPEALDALVWSLLDFPAEAVRWTEGRRILAEVLSPVAALKPPEDISWRSFDRDAATAAAARRIGDQPDLAATMAARDALAMLHYDRMLRAESELRRAGRMLTALESDLNQAREQAARREADLAGARRAADEVRRELAALREKLSDLEGDNERRGRAILHLEAETKRHNERILALQAEVEEKNRWAMALDRERKEHNERILALQREVEEKNAAIAGQSQNEGRTE